MKSLLVALLSLCLPLAAQTSTQMAFSYTMPVSRHNSAGVYDSTGALIRTLWSVQPQGAGQYTALWDGNTDAGTPATGTNFSVHVLTNNEIPVWEGGIGNTESSWTSINRWDVFGQQPATVRMSFVGATGWTIFGANEGTNALAYISGSNINTPQLVNQCYVSSFTYFNNIDNDGTRIYITNQGGFTVNTSTTVFDGITGNPSQFTNGIPPVSGQGFVHCPHDISTIDQDTTVPTGIAVQSSGGTVLAISHASANVIRFFNKNTGSAVGTNLTITNPTSMSFSSTGLWVIANGTLNLVTGASSSNTVTQPITGLSNPVYVYVQKSTNHIFVLDGGTSQQVKEYDPSLNLVSTYGQLGGYTTTLDPTLANDKFAFDNTAITGLNTANSSWIEVTNAGDIFLGDGGNMGRILHLAATTHDYLGYIWWNRGYQIAVSHTLPSRVMYGMIEFNVDYTKTIQPGDPDPTLGGNGSWKMVKNWAIGAGNHNWYSATSLYGISSLEQLSNGRVYGQATPSPESGIITFYGVELPSSGPLRFTGKTWSISNFQKFERDGSLTSEVNAGTFPTYTQTITSCPVSGFDGSGNPVWATCTTPVQTNTNPSTQPVATNGGWGAYLSWFPTSSGVYGAFQTTANSTTNPCVTNGFKHVAGMVTGNSAYTFQVMPEANILLPDLKGTFPCGSGFGGHQATSLIAEGKHIFAEYDGQYATWGEFFCDFWDDGLLISEFGKLSPYPPNVNPSTGALLSAYPAIPASGGNISAFLTTNVNGIIYGYNPNEGAGYTPTHRWKIDPSSIVEYGGSGTLGTGIDLTQIYP